jgi:hypothetical protein
MRGAGVEALILVPTPEINCYTKQLNELAAKAGFYRRLEATRKAPNKAC